jgi:hypothetical protein
MKRALKIVVVVSGVLIMCGCGPRKSAVRRGGETLGTGSAGPFVPSSYIARPTLSAGSQYPNLLSPESYTIWFTDEVAEVKVELEKAEGKAPADSEELLRIAKQLNGKYLILECHVVSAFPDSSIAYDITSFRHAEAFLMDDAGNKCEPLQVIIGSLERGNKGALREFRRVNLLVFPKNDLITGEPIINSHLRNISLAISGYKTTYFFSWKDTTRTAQPQRLEQDTRSIGAVSLGMLESALRFLVEDFK